MTEEGAQTDQELSSRLRVPAGKEAAELPGALPSTVLRRRVVSISPPPVVSKLRNKNRAKHPASNVRLVESLLPFINLLPAIEDVDKTFQERLALILLTTGSKAWYHIQRYFKACEDAGLAYRNSQGDLRSKDGQPVGGYVEEVAEALRNFVDPSDPDAVPNVSPDLASKALTMFGRSMMRRPPTYNVEQMMSSGQENPTSQSAYGDGADSPLDDERTIGMASPDNLFALACCMGYVELTELLIRARGGSTEFEYEKSATPLMEACAMGKPDAVRVLLKHGAAVNPRSSPSQNTALIYAAAAGHVECVRELLKTEKCCTEMRNDNGHCAMMEAASAGNLDVVKELVNAGAKSVYMNTNSEFKESPLTLAAYKGHEDLVDYLLTLERDPSETRDEELHTALMEASMDGHVAVAQKLLDNGAPVNLASDSFESPLTLASCGGHTELVRLLLDAGANIEEPNDESYTPLMEASREGHADTVCVLLAHKANVNAQTEETGETALTLAACGGFTDVVRLLIEAGGDVELGANSPLLEASQEGHLDTVKFILEHLALANVNVKNPTYFPHMHTSALLAADNNHLDVLMALEEYGAHLEYEADNRTPLMKAALNGYLDIVNYLIKMKVDVNQASSNGEATALSLACANGKMDVVEVLLSHGADPNVVLKDNSTCVLEAARNGHTAIVERLLDAAGLTRGGGNQTNLPLPTPAHPPTARNRRHRKVTSLMNPNQRVPPTRVGKMPPSSRAKEALQGSEADAALAQAFLQSHVHAHPSDERYNLAELPDLISFLYKDLGKPNPFENLDRAEVQDLIKEYFSKMRMTPETTAALRAKNLLPGQSHFPAAGLPNTPLTPAPPCQTAAHAPVAQPPPASTPQQAGFLHSTLESLRRSFPGLPLSLTGCSDPKTTSSSATPVVEKSSAAANASLPQSGLNMPLAALATPHNGGYDLHVTQMVAAYEKLQEKLMLALSEGGDPKLEEVLNQMHDQSAFIQPASEAGIPRRRTQSEDDARSYEDSITELQNKIMDMRDAIKNPTERKCGKKDADAANPPVAKGELSVDTQTESNHDTPLTLACMNGHADMVELLMARGANKEHRDKKGFTPLILAATGGHVNIVESLLNAGADPEAQSERTKDTALSLACSGGRKEVVELLLKKGANKEHRNVSDYTPLSLAASGGYVDIVVMLLDAGAEINSRTGSKLGISPLMLSAMNGHKEATRVLLERGSDINAQIETNRNTALTLACFQGRTEVVRLLLQYNANVEHRAKTGLTPLMEAANGGYSEVGELLLDAGADPNTSPVPSSRDTALTIAADKGHDKFVQMLVHRSAMIDAKNKKGCTALWLACNGGHLETVKILVDHIADTDAQDNRKVTPLMIAFRRGHSKVVKYIVQHVSQFPSEAELDRFIATILPTETELLAKCKECKIAIVEAMERQAKEAAKAAEALLQLLEEEEEQERNRRQTKQRQKEKKKSKRAKKAAELTVKGDEPESETESVHTNEAKENTPVFDDRVPLVAVELQDTNKHVAAEDSGLSTAEKQKQKRQEKKESQKKETQRKRSDSGRTSLGNATQKVVTQPQATPAKNPAVRSPLNSQQQEEWIKASRKTKGKTTRTSSQSVASSVDRMNQYFTDDNGAYGGWKDVELARRRASVLVLPSQGTARVIGRGGANINAIREATGASIEVEKQTTKREQNERQITIRGTADSVKYAVQMINGLIADQDCTVQDVIRQVLRGGNTSTASAASSDGGKSSIDYKSEKMAAGATVASNTSAPTTNVWQQRIAARQQQQSQQIKDEATKREGHPIPVEAHVPTSNAQAQVSYSSTSIGDQSTLSTLSSGTLDSNAHQASGERPPSPVQPTEEAPSYTLQESYQATAASFAAPSDRFNGEGVSSSPLQRQSFVDNIVTSAPSALPGSIMVPPSLAPLDILGGSRVATLEREDPTDLSALRQALPDLDPHPLINALSNPIHSSFHSDVQAGMPGGLSFINEPAHSRLAEIWGAGSGGEGSGDTWNTQLLLSTAFNPISTNRVESASDWASAAAADPLLSFSQSNGVHHHGSMAPSTASSAYSSMGGSSGTSDWNAMSKQHMMQQQQQQQQQQQLMLANAYNRTHGLSAQSGQQQQREREREREQREREMQQTLTESSLLSLAAKLAASQTGAPPSSGVPTSSVPITAPTSIPQYYPSPSYTDTSALGISSSAPVRPSNNSYQSCYQAVANEFENLANIINSYNGPNGLPPPSSEYQQLTRPSSNSGPSQCRVSYYPPTAPPPGFAPRTEMMSSVNTAVPPPGATSGRSPFFNVPPPPNSVNLFNLGSSSSSTAPAPSASSGWPTSQPSSHSMAPPQSTWGSGAWN